MKYLAALLLLFTTTAQISVQSSLENKKGSCASVEKSAPECQDKVDKSGSVSNPSLYGAWTINLRSKKVGDPPRAIIRVAGTSNSVRSTYFYAACRKGEITSWISFVDPLDRIEKEVPIFYVIDQGREQTMNLVRSFNARSVGLWDDATSKKLLLQLIHGKKLDVRIVPLLSEEMQASFPIEKVENVVQPLAEACAWDPAPVNM